MSSWLTNKVFSSGVGRTTKNSTHASGKGRGSDVELLSPPQHVYETMSYVEDQLATGSKPIAHNICCNKSSILIYTCIVQTRLLGGK